MYFDQIIIYCSFFQPPPIESEHDNPLNGIRPVQFRALVGRGHAEFSSPRQQDAEEYIRYRRIIL